MKLGNVVASEYDQSNVRENACSLEIIIQEQSTNVKMKEARNENEIFPDRDPHVEIQSEMNISSC